jgi:hypothetical protein
VGFCLYVISCDAAVQDVIDPKKVDFMMLPITPIIIGLGKLNIYNDHAFLCWIDNYGAVTKF